VVHTNVGGTNPEKVVYDVCQKVVHWVRNFPSNFFPCMSMVRDLSCSLIDVCGSFTELHVPENEHAQCSAASFFFISQFNLCRA